MKTVVIPDSVLNMTLFHRKPQAPQLVVLPESHAGEHGYSVFVDGHRVAWGRTEDAAIAAYQVARAA